VAAGAAAAAALGAAYAAWRLRHSGLWRRWPLARCSPRRECYLSERTASAKPRPGYRSFPKPFPNGWVFIGPSTAVPRAKVLPIEVCGRHLVAFRAADGTLGVLDAFCSHMGTHMGYGGYVSGECLVCPYHEWEFDATGKLRRIPYAPDEGRADCTRARNDMRSYPVLERHGMAFVWIHADGGEPWDLDRLLNLPDEKGLRPIARFVEDDYLMHAMEPSHNSTDWYHFQTVHSVMSQHWRARWQWLQIDQIIKPPRSHVEGSEDDDGSRIECKDLLIVDEVIRGVKLLNGWVRLPERLASGIATSQVRFSGPLLACFIIEVAFFGPLVLLMPITPTAPFVTHLEFWSFAGPRWPWLFAYVLARLIRNTVGQDREVWEHRAHPMPRNQVKGDYSWTRYDKWLQHFYTESSIGWDSCELSW